MISGTTICMYHIWGSINLEAVRKGCLNVTIFGEDRFSFHTKSYAEFIICHYIILRHVCHH